MNSDQEPVDAAALVGASRLPAVGTTIFTVMSALAAKTGAINLGQGFPDFDCDPALVEAVSAAMRAGHNQYPPMIGVPALRAAVAAKIERMTGHRYEADSEITITAGATQGILSTVLALVHPGDEVIVLEPCYDSYGPAITLAGGTIVRVPLTPGTWRPDFDALARAHRVGHGGHEGRVAVEVGEALAEVDRAGLRGQRGHHGEDRRADRRQPARADERGGVDACPFKAHSSLPLRSGRAGSAAASAGRTAARRRPARSCAGRRRGGTRPA